MKKSELRLLEQAFEAEIASALQGGIHLIQSKSKVARQLVVDGLLREAKTTVGTGRFPVTVSGYELTHAGRYAYCSQC